MHEEVIEINDSSSIFRPQFRIKACLEVIEAWAIMSPFQQAKAINHKEQANPSSAAATMRLRHRDASLTSENFRRDYEPSFFDKTIAICFTTRRNEKTPACSGVHVGWRSLHRRLRSITARFDIAMLNARRRSWSCRMWSTPCPAEECFSPYRVDYVKRSDSNVVTAHTRKSR